MTVYHAETDPDVLTRLRQTLGSVVHAEIASAVSLSLPSQRWRTI